MADFPFGETPESRGRLLTHARWEARLSDGRLAVQQDVGDGTEGETSSWLRLKAFCRQEGVSVRALSLRFRSHVVAAGPEGAAGYFLRPGVVGFAGGPTKAAYYAGHLDAGTGRVHVITWLVPELEPLDSEWRDPADPKGVGPSLIAAD